jgi:signal transduction histidine kinase
MSILAHDLKNPFNTILGFSDLLLANFRKYNADKIEQQLSILNKVSLQTYNLLGDLLLWSKSQSGKLPFEPVRIDFNQICTEIMTELAYFADSKRIKLINNSENKAFFLSADLNMLKTTLRNLIGNAIKFSYENGQVNISISESDSFALISIIDNGIGINAATQLKLWDLSMPHTTKGTNGETGTGLGLTLCKEFVEKHAGKIWVESESGKGSDFKFTIPFARIEGF